ncbi:hypothetical protein SLW70_15025 [Flavobacterium sp. NG2]|uniref:hypothetical protein n=1 Tax=Flavobacterium sp. NG2 TaxID=3097547 RepID=UPI002A82F8F4|nr:hypothetical protein [Flavobacterium sp. NG2]WPR71235.1 hypothetical protein SLW70_15025 [Flavobacterium sp. NG2]
MRKSVVLLVVALIMNVAFVSAKELSPRKSYARTTQELTSLLSPTSAVEELENDVVVKVRVLITLTGDIVVLETNAENKSLENYIKDNLNYKKLATNELEAGNDYVFEVNFKA